MIIAIAKQENVKLSMVGNVDCVDNLYSMSGGEFSIGTPYNPITDLALNCMLRDKYEVTVDYNNYDVVIFDANAGEFDSGYIAASSFKEGDIPHAILECILKSQGLYNE